MVTLFDVLSNQVIFATLFAWVVSQAIKLAHLSAAKDSFSLKDVWESERFPSSHAALVTALSVSILMTEGVTTLFAISLIFAVIVLRDAVGVRRKVGEHAKHLNKTQKTNFSEMEGHSIAEAAAGIFVGAFVAAFVISTNFTLINFLQILYFMLPGILANASPVLVKKIFPYGDPVDEKLFGKNKTWRGLIVGVFTAWITLLLQGKLYLIGPFYTFSMIPYTNFNLLLIGFLLGVGIMGGDLIKSYFKRRQGIKEGKKFFPWDQIDSLVGGLVAIAFFVVPTPIALFVMLMMTFVLSAIFNAAKVDLRL